VFGRPARGDAPFTFGEVLYQEGHHACSLADSRREPPYLPPVRQGAATLVGTIHPEAGAAEFARAPFQILRRGAEVDQAPTGRGERAPAPDVVARVLGVDERDQLQVGAVLERDQGVPGQAVGVRTAGRHREPEALIIARGPVEIPHQDDEMVQADGHAAVIPWIRHGRGRLGTVR
jgi:hypothetical protein